MKEELKSTRKENGELFAEDLDISRLHTFVVTSVIWVEILPETVTLVPEVVCSGALMSAAFSPDNVIL